MPTTTTHTYYRLEELDARAGEWKQWSMAPTRTNLRQAEADYDVWVRWWGTLADEHKRIYGGRLWNRPDELVRIVKVMETVVSERVVIRPPGH